MTHEIIYQIDTGEYDLLTREELEDKDDEFWSETGEGWQSQLDEVDLQKLVSACERRNIPTSGIVTTRRDGGALLMLYTSKEIDDAG